MPNIEIYGLSDPKSSWQLHQVKDAIRAAVAELGLVEDTVITTLESLVEQCSDGSPAPFIRVVSTDRSECLAIRISLVQALRKTDSGCVDIEELVIHHFFEE